MNKTTPVPRKAVIYARVSTEHEEQLSALGNQIVWYDSILAQHPEWQIVGRYIDEGITGTSAEKRPRFMDMIRDAKMHKFDLILTREVSRFARNTVDTLQYTRELKEYGVEVVFLNDGIWTFDGDGELRLGFMASIAQEESRKTSVRVKAGQKISMEKGVPYGNGNILGYHRINGAYIIEPEQAETVRMIFDMYLGGMGVTKIKYALEEAGRLTATGSHKWYASYIAHMLKNSFYCGIITYHKEYTPDYLKQKKILNHGEIDFLKIEGNHEPIVSKDEFDRVQELMKQHSAAGIGTVESKVGLKPHNSVWGRLLICQCGSRFNAHYHARSDRTSGVDYQCYTSLHHGSIVQRAKRGLPIEDSCDSPFVSGWKLEMMACMIFRNYIRNGSEIVELACTMLEKHIHDTAAEHDNTENVRQKRTEIEHLHRKLDNLIEMREDGDIDKQTFRSKKQELESKISVLSEEILKISEASPETVQENLSARFDALKEKLETYVDFSTPVIPEHIVEAFIEKILVTKEEFCWYLRTGNTDNSHHVKLVDFTIPLEEAKKYLYSISPKRRVLRYTDLHVSVWL